MATTEVSKMSEKSIAMAIELMREFSTGIEGLVFELSLEENSRAYMTMWEERDPSVWFSIRYSGGELVMFDTMNWFGDFRLWENTDSPEELRGYLNELIDEGRAFLEQRPTPTGRFFPKIVLNTASGEVVLTQNLNRSLHNILTFRWLRRR